MKPGIFLAMLLTCSLPGAAAAPDWLRSLVSAALPPYPSKTNAVVLLDEQITTIKDSGEIKTVYRRAWKILRPEGHDYGLISVAFDNDTRLTFLKAWSFPPRGAEYELKEKDAMETGLSGDSLYAELKHKVMRIPAAEPGSIVGYEFEQKDRPFLLQHIWSFQEDIPVRKARFTLQLPAGWEYKHVWMNHPDRNPVQAGQNQWVWELEDLPALEWEPMMPDIRAVSGRMAVTYFPKGPDAGKSHASWRDVGAWYAGLAASRVVATPEIRQKTAEITQGAATLWEKVRALARFAQSQIRYVSIPIGIGSHQPHAAQEILTSRYGDCKDKVTLLKTMLREIGINSYYLLVHSNRGAVSEKFASVLNFNHVILAIPVPPGETGAVFAIKEHPSLGKLLLFDPTDSVTPLGQLPASLEASYGLLVRDEGGELLELPLLPQSANRLLRSASLKLSPEGTLSGNVQEIRWGAYAAESRSTFLHSQGGEQTKALESFLNASLSGFELRRGSIENLERIENNLVLSYAFTAPDYGKKTGNLLLVRPRVLGHKGMDLSEKKDRKHPFTFSGTGVQSDLYEIEIPVGYEVDELPPPAEADYPFARYLAKIEVNGRVLRYERHYLIKQIIVPVEKFEDVKKLFRQISLDERRYAVLKRTNM